MTPGRDNENGHLHENVARLLASVPPERPLPQEAKRRILAALIDRARVEGEQPTRKTRRGSIGWKRLGSWAAAAAAAVVVALIALWPGGMQSGLAWADVAQHLAEARSVIAWATSEATPPSGGTRVTRARLLQKDPGMTRTETFSSAEPAPHPGEPVPTEAVESIAIMIRSPRESTLTRLYPGERRARRTTLSFSGKALEARERMTGDMVGEMFARLRGLTEDQTRVVGEREIGGRPAVGFAARMAELLGDAPAPPLDGTVRVWASRETALPLEVEVEFTDPHGTAHHTTYGPIEWNPPLEEGLFTPPDLNGWWIFADEIREVWFSRTSLRAGVSLSIGPAGGPAVVTEEDVDAVLSGRIVRASDAAAPRMTIFLAPKLEGVEKIRSYTAAHLGESLQVDFNGETRYEIRIGGVIGAEMQLDVSALGLTPEEFERRFLTD